MSMSMSAACLDGESPTMNCESVAETSAAAGTRAESSAGILQYSRNELLALQEGHADFQEGGWLQVLANLGSDVAEELHELEAVPDSNRSRRRSKNSERRLRSRAKQRDVLQGAAGNALGRHGDEEDENVHEESTNWHRVRDRASHFSDTRKSSWDSRASYTEERAEVDSFQPQAFAVEGEPDFDSGPPQDGWEYLRRVKHEAARCPKVVVAEIDPTKLISEQTAYMPEIPEISACPPDLLPSTDWEKRILEDFSSLRMALSNVRMPRKSASERIPSLRNKAAWEVRCFGSITSLQQEEATALDTFSGKNSRPEVGNTEVAKEAADLFPISSAESRSTFVDDESGRTGADNTRETPLSFQELQDSTRDQLSNQGSGEVSGLTGADNTKETPLSFQELQESKRDQLSNEGSGEVSYVIDLKLLSALPGPGFEETGSVSDSDYLIINRDAEETLDLMNAVDDDHSCVHEVLVEADSEANIAEPDSCSSHVVEQAQQVGPFRNSSPPTGSLGESEGRHGDDEGQAQYLPFVCPDYTDTQDSSCRVYSDDVTTFTSGRPLRDSDSEIEVGEHRPPTQMDGDAAGGASGFEASFPFLDVLDKEEHRLVPEAIVSSSSNTEPFEHVEFAEICRGIDTQFECLAIADAEGPHSEMIEVTLPSFLDGNDFPELEDVYEPRTDFMNFPVGLEIYNSGNILEDEPAHSDDFGEFKLDPSIEGLCANLFQLSGVSQLPLLQLLLSLDEVSRAALLRYHVSWLETLDGLPEDRAIWLLALSAVIDVPLDAQTGAAFRALLRHCSRIRAMKRTRDGDLHMLNMLITVAGLYFGQAEATL